MIKQELEKAIEVLRNEFLNKKNSNISYPGWSFFI